jgi:hypothetical protein
MELAFERLVADAPRSVRPGVTGWLPPARSYVLLAACRDVEAALEASVDGKPRAGVLTDAFLEALASLGEEQLWRTVYDRVLARVHSRFVSQTPQILGDLGRAIFGVALRPVPVTFTVTGVDAGRGTVTIDGGLATTITRGTEIGVYAPGETDFSLADRRVAEVSVVEARDLESVARVMSGDLARIELGAPAVIHGLALRRRVGMLVRDDLPPEVAARQGAALAAVRAAVSTHGKGFLEICPEGQAPHYQVAVTEGANYQISDPQGAPYRYLEPSIPVDRPDAAAALVHQLRRLGRYHAVLEMSEPASTLGEQVGIELLLAPPGWTDALPAPSTGGTRLARDGDAYTVKNDTWVWLRVTNRRPSTPVNVALLGLDREWEIEMIVPSAEEPGKKYVTVAEQPQTLTFQMWTPVPEAIDVLKVFLTTGDVDFTRLCTRSSRGAAWSPAGHALDRLFASLDADENRAREATPARSLDAPWTVREFRFRTTAN